MNAENLRKRFNAVLRNMKNGNKEELKPIQMMGFLLVVCILAEYSIWSTSQTKGLHLQSNLMFFHEKI